MENKLTLANALPTGCVVKDADIDLTALCNTYSGYGRIQRLLYIGRHGVGLTKEAFSLAVKYIKEETYNVELYIDTINAAADLLKERSESGAEEFDLDEKWQRTSNKAYMEALGAAEEEYQKRIRDAVDSAISKALEKLAEVYEKRGEFASVLGHLLDMKEKIESREKSLEVSANIARVGILCGNYSQVRQQCKKTRSLDKNASEIMAMSNAKLYICMGIYELRRCSFKAAAASFFQVDQDIEDQFSDIATMEDVVKYGILAALVEVPRNQLQQMYSQETTRKLLEFSPEMLRIFTSFLRCDYGECFRLLQNKRKQFLMDVILAPQIDLIIRRVRDRAMVEYFKPFTSVRLSSMSKWFQLDEDLLELEVVRLIESKEILGRIDSHNRILYAKSSDERALLFESSIDLGNKMVRDARSALHRMALIQNDLVISMPSRRGMEDMMDFEGDFYSYPPVE